MFGRGIWAEGDLVDRGIERGVLSRAGSWISWGKDRLGQGREKVARLFEADPERAQALRTEVLARAEKSAELGTDPLEEGSKAA